MTTTALYSAVFTPDGRGLTLRLQLAACGAETGMHKSGSLRWRLRHRRQDVPQNHRHTAQLIIWLSEMDVLAFKHGCDSRGSGGKCWLMPCDDDAWALVYHMLTSATVLDVPDYHVQVSGGAVVPC